MTQQTSDTIPDSEPSPDLVAEVARHAERLLVSVEIDDGADLGSTAELHVRQAVALAATTPYRTTNPDPVLYFFDDDMEECVVSSHRASPDVLRMAYVASIARIAAVLEYAYREAVDARIALQLLAAANTAADGDPAADELHTLENPPHLY